MQKGKGKALRNFSLALFSLVLKQDSANRMEAYMQHAICGKKLPLWVKCVSAERGHGSKSRVHFLGYSLAPVGVSVWVRKNGK